MFANRGDIANHHQHAVLTWDQCSQVSGIQCGCDLTVADVVDVAANKVHHVFAMLAKLFRIHAVLVVCGVDIRFLVAACDVFLVLDGFFVG